MRTLVAFLALFAWPDPVTIETHGPAKITLSVEESAPAPVAQSGNPLPVLGCWNTGQNQQADGQDTGYHPDWQYQQITAGVPWVPTFQWWDWFPPSIRAQSPWYYEPLWSYARDNKLPLVFVGNQFPDLFRLAPPWSGPVPADHPFLVRADGTIVKTASPWSPNVHQWYALGSKVGAYLSKEFAGDYPDPPAVWLMDNNEVGYARVDESRTDARCPAIVKEAFAKLSEPQARQVARYEYSRAMAIRFSEFRRGLRDALPEGWKRIRHVGYMQFGNEYGGADYQPDNLRNTVPWVGAEGGGVFQFFDGASCRQYLSEAQALGPGVVRSPQMEAGCVRFALDEYRRTVNPAYEFESHLFNGKVHPAPVWLGVVRCTLWQSRPDHARLFLSSTQTVASTYARDMEPLVTAVREVRDNPTLRRFWQFGRLMPNRWTRDFAANPKVNEWDTATGAGHPYNNMLPSEYRNADRLFIQNVPINNRLVRGSNGLMQDRWAEDRTHQTPVPVFAVALELDGEYLVFAHAPNGAVAAAEIQICPNGPQPVATLTVDVPVEGAFWIVSGGNVTRI